MDDGHGAVGGGCCGGRAAHQERGRPPIRGLAPLGDHAGPAVPGRGRGRVGTTVSSAVAQSAAHTGRRSRTRSSRSARSSTGAATRPARRPSRSTSNGGTAPPRRSRRSGGSWPPAGSSPHNRTSVPRAAMSGSSPNNPTSAGRSTSPTGPWPTAPRSRSSTSSMTTPASVSPASARRVFKAGDVDDCFGIAATHYGNPATVLTDNGAVFTGRYRGQGRVALEVTLARRGIRLPPLPALPPPDLRQGGTVPPDPQALAHHPASGPDPATAPSPARHLPQLLQHPAAPPRPWPAHPDRGLPGPAQGHPRPASPWTTPTTASATTRSTPAACSPCATTAGSTTSASADATPAPTSWSWSTIARSASSPTTASSLRELQLDPVQGLPTTAPNVNDVARHLCTVSRDITVEPLAGLEPATYGLEVDPPPSTPSRRVE